MPGDKSNTLALTLEEAAMNDDKSLRSESRSSSRNLGELFVVDGPCGGHFDPDGVAAEGGDEVDFATVIDSKVRKIAVAVLNGAEVPVYDGFENSPLQLGIFRRLRGKGEQQPVIRGVDLGVGAKLG